MEAAAGDHTQECPGDRDGREHGENDAHGEQDREPTHGARGEGEEDKRGDESSEVTVEDRLEALLVAEPHGGAGCLSAPDLLFDTLEDYHVRVGGYADTENYPRDTGQRHRYRYGDDKPPQQEGVDEECQVRYQPERPVDDYQEHEHEPEPHERRQEP